jgi:hypothetical protein
MPATATPAPDPGPGGAPPEAWCDEVLETARSDYARFETKTDDLRRRLCDIRSEVLRVECLRCFRIQRLDAIKLYDAGSLWKEIGTHLLESGRQHRTGSRDQDGCWPRF